ncbi:hypothetical protein WJX82_004695 [Trebouxia sp. C0006]
MALDERRLVRQTELQESFLIAERQKAVMFATLNRARQTLEDQGAQPQPVDGSDSAARGNIAFPPFLWMPHSPADTTQQGLPRAGSQGTVLNGVRMVEGGWQARLGYGRSKSKQSLGTYSTEYAAARAYDRALLIHRPTFEVQNNLNFPVSDYPADSDPCVSRAATAAVSQLQRIHANKRRRQWPESHSSPLNSARQSQHRWSEHTCAAQPSSKAHLPPAAKKTKHDQPMSDADHSSSAKAAAGLGPDADADSFSASYSTLQSPARANSPNSWHKNLNGHLGVYSPQAGQHSHSAPVGTDSSEPVCRGQGDVASQGAGLKAQNLLTETEPSRDEDQEAVHPVKQQRTVPPFAPFNFSEQAQHIPVCLSIATKAAYAVDGTPVTADPMRSKGFAPQPAEPADGQEAEASGGQSPKQESPEVVETVRAGDSDDDVEIMDDSPVRPSAHMLFSPSPDPLAGLVLLRQQSQNSSPINGQLRTKQGLQHEAGAAVGPSSKLARTSRSDAGVRAGGNSNKTGATAAEAVNLSDDDDDVVIIEEGMQPQSATTAPAKQPGAPVRPSVAELRRTEQQSDVGFKAAQELEWQKREAEISRQAEEARRLKRQRRAANEKAAKQQAQLGQRLAEHRQEEQRKEAEEEQKEKLRFSCIRYSPVVVEIKL